MQKQMIALSGAANTGKSTALREMCRRFLKDGASDIAWVDGKQLSGDQDIAVILTYKNVKIGIYSLGDVWCGPAITEHLDLYKKRGCTLILCASRTRGETCQTINAFSNEYDISWFSEFNNGYIDQDSLWYKILDIIAEFNAWPRTVWKFGCRWNETGTPDDDTKIVFRNCNVAFTVTDKALGIYEGDLIAVADGFKIIAIGMAMTLPASLADFKWSAREHALLDYYMKDDPAACRVKYYWLEENEQIYYPKQGRFCCVNDRDIQLQVNELYDKKSKQP